MASSIYDPYCIFLTQASIGAPMDRDPVMDNLIDAADINKVNNFDYSDDPDQIRCPFAAHLRKMNPRNSAIPSLEVVQTRRII